MRERILRMEAVLKLHSIRQMNGEEQLRTIIHMAREL